MTSGGMGRMHCAASSRLCDSIQPQPNKLLGRSERGRWQRERDKTEWMDRDMSEERVSNWHGSYEEWQRERVRCQDETQLVFVRISVTAMGLKTDAIVEVPAESD